MESMKFIDISIMNQGTSQGKSRVVKWIFKVMCEVRWTLNWGTKVGKRVVNNPLSYTHKKESIKY